MDNATRSETELLESCLTGDTGAFGLIVERYQALVCAITYSGTGDLTLSEDIAQETFLAAWRQLGQLRDTRKFRSWLSIIARNLTRHALRRRKKAQRPQPLQDVAQIASQALAPDQQLIQAEDLTILRQALDEIPIKYREPMVLFYREHQSIRKVAEMLGLTEATVKQRLSRGRKKLKREVAAMVETTLERTRPGKAFATAVLAGLLTGTAKNAEATVVTVSAVGAAGAKTAFWCALGSALIGATAFLLAQGYITLIIFLGLSAFLLLRRPDWFWNRRTRAYVAIGSNLVLIWCFASLDQPYWAAGSAFLALSYLLVLHPGCPQSVRRWLTESPLDPWKKWDWQEPPKNWKSALRLYLSFTFLFAALTVYIICRTHPHIGWGFVAMSSILSLSFAVHSTRLVVKVWRHHRHIGK